jgi:hypothetical protein
MRVLEKDIGKIKNPADYFFEQQYLNDKRGI